MTEIVGLRSPRMGKDKFPRSVGRLPYLPRWIVAGGLAGAVAGLGAIALQGGLNLVTDLAAWTSGYRPAGTSNTAGGGGGSALLRWWPEMGVGRSWLLPLVVAAGILVSALIVRAFAREAGGHGTDAAIHAANSDPTGVRTRVPLVKLVASAVTLGSGGSGGTEGPAAQISAGVGSGAARLFGLSRADARIALAAGMAAGIGAIFHTPLGAAVLGAELLVFRGLDPRVLFPAAISTLTSFVVFGLVFDTGPLLGDHAGLRLGSWSEVGLVALVALVAGLLARAFVWSFHAIEARIAGLGCNWMMKAVAGGALVGLVGLSVPGVLGTGYGMVGHIAGLNRDALLAASPWLLAAIPLAKILLTTVTIGSGGSAGVFGPTMVIGAWSGLAVWRFAESAGWHTPSAAPFVIAGLVAALGPAVRAPAAVLIMAVEATRAFALAPELLLATAVGVLVMGRSTLYPSQRESVAGTTWSLSQLAGCVRKRRAASPGEVATTTAAVGMAPVERPTQLVTTVSTPRSPEPDSYPC